MEGDFLSYVISAHDFSLIAKKTTDMANIAEFYFNLICRLKDARSRLGCKVVAALFYLIGKVKLERGIDVTHMIFDGTNI